MIHRISAADPRFEPYRHVGDPAWLEREGLFVGEGRFVVERLLASGDYDLQSIVVTPAAREALSAPLEAAACDVYLCDPAELETVTGFNFHRGCLALATRPAAQPLTALRGARRLVALEGVGNPDNVGGLFRTAAALGADGLLLDPASADPFYRKAIRTSMAATLQLPWVRLDRWLEGLAEIKQWGFTLAALTPDPGAATLDEFAHRASATDKVVLLVGAEGAGLSAAALQLADARVRIAIDPSVDSLNVVVAAGIALDRLR